MIKYEPFEIEKTEENLTPEIDYTNCHNGRLNPEQYKLAMIIY